ncbi:hypothetical protein GCM10016234_16290 [Tianweitania populi]|uniref:Uncharacterized protein n=1 Tax=Tianweitania populi TaxID=1607949 RepID=A0A8J3DYB0_9HYPH|nr:hypothetical protein GCM10016234_16290 [Tianweitania populi]
MWLRTLRSEPTDAVMCGSSVLTDTRMAIVTDLASWAEAGAESGKAKARAPAATPAKKAVRDINGMLQPF